ncbi:uncharacterized protein TEOVI_000480500 [Trypanosoma equiperdum]|uniref:Trypanosome variant surface glycoprotein (A-type) n=1 Tax=Trypanosoma equiperdum TaxID=5694 RepID=A0A1G4IA57_TRYEQ|nr:hypothetical protein TEOVI_000480500 [Trypanosoma equiperdum]
MSLPFIWTIAVLATATGTLATIHEHTKQVATACAAARQFGEALTVIKSKATDLITSQEKLQKDYTRLVLAATATRGDLRIAAAALLPVAGKLLDKTAADVSRLTALALQVTAKIGRHQGVKAVLADIESLSVPTMADRTLSEND